MPNKRYLLSLLIISLLLWSCAQHKDNRTQFFPNKELTVDKVPDRDNLWVFVLAGQSNMAGRGLVEPQDTVSNSRVYTINAQGDIIYAKEPLHFYEPSMTGLDSGLSFGKALIKQIPDSISVLLIPTAVGGSSITQWLNDSEHRKVKLLTNFKEKVALGMRFGALKGILWHQGESDAKPDDVPQHYNRLSELFHRFRGIAGNDKIPIILGELGSYSTNELWPKINEQLNSYVSSDPYAGLIKTSDLQEKGDKVHFNSEAQRTMGERYASVFMKMQE